jgi:putative hemolysin
MLIDILIILALVVLNGWFAMAELAIVSSRRARLQAMARRGRKGARIALELSENPGRFLSTVQVGITLIAVLSGAFSGAALSQPVHEWLEAQGVPSEWAGTAAFALVVAFTTYLSVIVGELVPKQLALRNAEPIAAGVAPIMRLLTRVGAPIAAVLEWSGNLVLRLFGSMAEQRDAVSEEEVRMLIAEGARTGVFEPAEREMVDRVLRFGDRSVRSIMTPRGDVDWLELNATREEVMRTIEESRHTRFPVGRGSLDDIVGIVHLRQLTQCAIDGVAFDLASLVEKAPVLYDATDILKALEVLRNAGARVALVVDEYGGFEGLVTLTDILEAAVGALPEAGRDEDEAFVTRDDGSVLVDGMTAIEDLKLRLGLHELPGEDEVETVGGFVLIALGRVPKTGDKIKHAGWVFEVIDMDGRRVDKVLAHPPKGDELLDDTGGG